MKVKNGFVLRTVMGQNIILAEGNNSDTFGKIITLNSSAAMLWKKIKGKNFDVDYIADLLVKNYRLDRKQAVADATCFIDLMEEKGLIAK